MNQNRTKFIIFVAFVLSFLFNFTTTVLADEKSRVPDWLERTNFAIEIATDKEPRYYVETVQPLYTSDDEDRTIFTQGRVSVVNEKGVISLGFGWREMYGEELLGGINSFVDFEDEHKHYRTGIGFELIGKRAEGRINTYVGLSPQRKVKTAGGNETFQEAADGFDYEIGTPVPYLPWMKIFGGGQWYHFTKSDNLTGWNTRLEMKPSKYITIDFKVSDDNKGETEYGGEFAVNIPFATFGPEIITSAIEIDDEPYPDYDLRERRLDPVEREFVIMKEKWVQSSGLVIEAGRSN